ncbi:MAG: TMEM175 family protein [Ktedonobacterales bacterium]
MRDDKWLAAATRDTSRLEAFSDGVFAVAATLLVLNLQPPALSRGGTLLAALLSAEFLPKLVVYVISFAFILIMWVNHHNMFRVVRRSDHGLLLLNGLVLLLVTLVPFPTALLAAYAQPTDRTTAAVVFNGTYLLISFAFTLLWWYLTRHPHLLSADHDPAAGRASNRRDLFGMAGYLTCVVLAFVSVPVSLALNVALAVFWAWPRRVQLGSTSEG